METLSNQATGAHPNECCGILLGQANIVTAAILTANVHPAPETHFEIDPQALVNAHRRTREDGSQVLGYYHSHPQGPAHPSPTDAAQAAGDNRIWAIIAPGETTWWRDASDGFTPLSLALADG